MHQAKVFCYKDKKELPTQVFKNIILNIINDVYGNIRKIRMSKQIFNTATLALMKDDYWFMNENILNRLSGEETFYYTFVKVRSDQNKMSVNNYLIDIWSYINVSGMQP